MQDKLMNKLISIVVPIYNEAEIIEESIKQLMDLTQKINYPCELIVVDDGSSDCLLYTSPSPRDGLLSRMRSSA